MTILQDIGLVVKLKNYQEEGLITKIFTHNNGIITFFSKKIAKKQKNSFFA